MKSAFSSDDLPAAGDSTSRAHPLDWARAAGEEDLVEREMNACLRRKRRRLAAISAACTLVLVAGVAWFSRSGAFKAEPAGTHMIVSAPERQVLPDGSIVELKTGTQIAVDYSGRARRVDLRRGEAYFRVAKNPARPFVVAVDGVEFRAVGTAFSVERGGTQIELLVTEGRVAVEKPVERAPAVRSSAENLGVVDAGQRMMLELAAETASAPPVVTSVPAAALSERLAWRVPLVEFNFTPLSEVLPVFNQYGPTLLSLADPGLGKLKLSGVLRADNTPVLLRILETSYGLNAQPNGAGLVIGRAQ